MFIVTGGAGFIGSNLIKTLETLYPQENVIVVDKLGKDEKWQNLVKRVNISNIVFPSELPVFLDSYSKGKQIPQIKAVFHLGAISSTVERDVDLIIETNIHLTRLLWDWCTQEKIPFIYASSAATYGDGKKGFSDDMTLENLNTFRPLNAYGWSKHFFDLQALSLSKKNLHPPQWAGLKFFNVYGPNEHHKEGQKSVVSTFFSQIQKEGLVRLFKSTDSLYEDGGQLRDFIWVQDCVGVMIWLYQNPTVSGIFNVGTGKARSFNDLAKAVFHALSKPTNIQYIDMPETLREKYQSFTEASLINLIKAGYSTPFTSLEDGVKDYVQNFLMNADSYL